MKRLICSSLFFLIVIVGFSQENRYIRVNRNDGGFSQIQTSSVDSIVWSYFDWDEGLTDTWRSQIIYTKDRQYIIPLFSVESVLFNMPFVETEVIRYSVLPLDNVFDWDSFMLMSNDYYSVIKTDSDGITTIALDRVYSKNFSKAIIAQFSENMNPIYLLTDETTVFFFNYREDKVDVIIDYKGEIFHVENVIVDNAQQTKTRREGVSENHYWGALNKLFTYCNITSNVTKSVTQESGKAIANAVIDDAGMLGVSVFEKSPEINTVISEVGIGIGAIVGGAAALPVAVGATILNGANYIEEKGNQAKKEMYSNYVGDSKIHTLRPEKKDDHTYRIGVKVEGTSTIPIKYAEKDNEFGILLKKQPLSKSNWTLNLYDIDAVLYYYAHLEKDGVYYVDLPVELGYKYLYCGYIVTCDENQNIKRVHGGPISAIDARNSYAYYGDKEEIIMDYAMIHDYRQTDADYSDGVLIFEADVDVEFSSDEVKEATEYGISLYRNGIPVNKEFPLDINTNKGTVHIIFEAEKEYLTIDKENFTAETKDYWSIGPYVKNKSGLITNYYESINPLALKYDKKPIANTLKPVYRGTTTAMVECEFGDFMFWDGVCKIQYWEKGKSPNELTLEHQLNGMQKVLLVGLTKETFYNYKAVVNNGDKVIAEGTEEQFETWDEMVKLTNFVQTGATYKKDAFENDGIKYSYKYDVAVTFELVDDLGIKDWGYKYIDLEGKIKDISLMGKKSPYTDTDYSYYRNTCKSWVTYQPYVEFAGVNDNVTKRALGYEKNEESGFWYGELVNCDLIYDSQPQARTLAMDNIEELRAFVMCEYIGVKEINGLCGVEYWAESEIHKEKVLEIEEDGEYLIEMSDLIPNTVYHCRAFIKNDSIYIRADSTITFETRYNPNVRLIDFKQNASYYLPQSFGAYGRPGKYDYKYYSQFIIETELQYPIIKYGCLYRTPNGDYSDHDFWDEYRLENGIIYFSTPSNLPEDSLVIIPYVMVDTEDGWTREYGKKMVFSLTHNGNFSGCPDENHPHAIDLGLPSGTKWACCNVGAKVPEQNGGHYMWGESVEKSFYDWTTYKYAIEWDKFEDIGSDISGTQYDAATVLWGNGWQMPTEAQVEELLSSGDVTPWAPYNGIYGKYVIVRNGASIFLPLNGSMWGNDTSNSIGGYWTSTHDVTNPTTAKSYQFPNNSIISIYSILRYTGRAIRAVQSQ